MRRAGEGGKRLNVSRERRGMDGWKGRRSGEGTTDEERQRVGQGDWDGGEESRVESGMGERVSGEMHVAGAHFR
ncbi:hypothetical protein EES41_36710 [Streptomyces sp. ADI95-16]|nr:hypothetical protein EES41_36710 [Streptomyces sp. ADI95-16]